MKKKFESFGKLAFAAVLTKNEQKNVLGGDYGGGGGGGGGTGITWTLYCWKNGASLSPPFQGSGTCPTWSAGTSMCIARWGSGTVISNLYC